MFLRTDPTVQEAYWPAFLATFLAFSRNPNSNYIFDEQEALLGNPYANGHVPFLDVLKRDFWGLPYNHSIGSYRPLPNLVWRITWGALKPWGLDKVWLPHFLNMLGHSLNAALLAALVLRITRDRALAWLAGGVFVLSAVLTETVSGVVGIADVMGGMGVLFACYAILLSNRWVVLLPIATFLATMFALLSKESGIVMIPLVAWFALLASPALHPIRPLRLVRTLSSLVGTIGGLIAYTYLRRANFPVTLPAELQQPLPVTEPLYRRALHEFLRWFQQPQLPTIRSIIPWWRQTCPTGLPAPCECTGEGSDNAYSRPDWPGTILSRRSPYRTASTVSRLSSEPAS